MDNGEKPTKDFGAFQICSLKPRAFENQNALGRWMQDGLQVLPDKALSILLLIFQNSTSQML